MMTRHGDDRNHKETSRKRLLLIVVILVVTVKRVNTVFKAMYGITDSGLFTASYDTGIMLLQQYQQQQKSRDTEYNFRAPSIHPDRNVATALPQSNRHHDRWDDSEPIRPCQIEIDKQKGVTNCCASWDVNMDEWWSLHYEWQVGKENKTHYCLEKIQDSEQLAFLYNVSKLQWGAETNCSNVWAGQMVNSGYAAGVTGALKSFLSAVEARRPFQMARRHKGSSWRFSPMLDQLPVDATDCISRDLFCYFIPISKCQTQIGQNQGARRYIGKTFPANHPQRIWLNAYMTRPRRWTRRRLYHNYLHSPRFVVNNFAEPSETLASICAVLHVRRTDVLLEQNWKQRRHYFAIADYLRALNASTTKTIRNILLLTDDQTAVDEALQLHTNESPSYIWTYVNRTRFSGTSGGLNNHLPSEDPVHETMVILAELRLAARCQVLVHTKSGFVYLILTAMGYPHNSPHVVRIDEGRQPTKEYTQTAKDFFRQVGLAKDRRREQNSS